MKKLLLRLSVIGSLLLYFCIAGDAGKKYRTLDKIGMIVTLSWVAIFMYANIRRKKK